MMTFSHHATKFACELRSVRRTYWFSGRLHKHEKSTNNLFLNSLIELSKKYTKDDRYNGPMAEFYVDGNDRLARHSDSKMNVIQGTYTFWY